MLSDFIGSNIERKTNERKKDEIYEMLEKCIMKGEEEKEESISLSSETTPFKKDNEYYNMK